MHVEFDYGDIIIPLTKSESDQHGRNVCQALAGIPLDNMHVNLSNVFWFIVNRAPHPGIKGITKAEMKLVNALLQLSKINYIRNMFVGAGGRLVPSQKADTIAYDLSTKTWNHKMLRDRSGVEFDAPRRQCIRIPSPPGPSPSPTPPPAPPAPPAAAAASPTKFWGSYMLPAVVESCFA